MSNLDLSQIVSEYQTKHSGISELKAESLCLVAGILKLQESVNLKGDILEIGVNRAGTAVLLATGMTADEKLFLVDPTQDVDVNRQRILDHSSVEPEQVVFFKHDSTLLAKSYINVFDRSLPSVRLAHIDGEHSYDAVYSDVKFTMRSLGKYGLIVLDDIFNPDSACCTHAMFDLLRDEPTLHCVAMGFGKAYLCESHSIGFYRKFFSTAPGFLKQWGINIRLCYNSWGYERSYFSMNHIEEGELPFQMINGRFASFEELVRAVGVNM